MKFVVIRTLVIAAGGALALSHSYAAPLAPAKPVKTVKVKTKKAAPAPKAPEVFAAIEDEDLVLIPENEVFAPNARPAIETVAIPKTVVTQPVAKPAAPVEVAHPTTPKTPAFAETIEPANPSLSTVVTVSVRPEPAPNQNKSVDYYRVESKDINTLTYRLRIVQAILEESGKAYDYRSLKTKELVKILNRVRAERRTYELNTVLETPQLAE